MWIEFFPLLLWISLPLIYCVGLFFALLGFTRGLDLYTSNIWISCCNMDFRFTQWFWFFYLSVRPIAQMKTLFCFFGVCLNGIYSMTNYQVQSCFVKFNFARWLWVLHSLSPSLTISIDSKVNPSSLSLSLSKFCELVFWARPFYWTA